MKNFPTFTRFVTTLLWCLSTAAFAQSSVKLEHDSSWELSGHTCTIRVFQLANLKSEDTGPLFLSIYARPDAGYDGANSPGRLIARAAIDSLVASETRNNIVVTAKAHATRPREQFTALLVEQQTGRRTFSVLDYVVYTSTYTFPRRQSGGVGSEDAAIGTGDLSLQGVTLGGLRRHADFTVEKIQNQRFANVTGPLRLAVYATPAPYDGSQVPIIIATRPLGMLAQGDSYTHLQGRFTLKRPGRGVFYLALALEEDQGSGFQRVVFAASPDPRQF